MEKESSLDRRLFAEFLGSLLLVFTAISPIILGYNVLGSGLAVAVLMDAIAVGLVLFFSSSLFGTCLYFMARKGK
jgi:hypothetical protein